MRYPLYSELRTAYESTSENPRTFRVTIKLKDMVDEAVLYDAVQKTMERYPYYRVRLGIDENELFFLDNPAPTPVLPSCETPLTLELSAMNGSFYVNFMQFFEEDDYLRAFIGQLRENDINYDVLYQEQTKYPGFLCPWS